MEDNKNLKFQISNLRLLRVWLKMSSMAAQSQLLTNWAGVMFLVGKVVRFLMFFLFLFIVVGAVGSLVGYNRQQVILFFLIFNLIDITTQFLFRGVYQFRQSVVSGNYDIYLVRPLPSFLVPVFGFMDIQDFITLLPLAFYLGWYLNSGSVTITTINFLVFLLLFANSLVLAFAFHLFVCSICILTTQIDPLVWIYRDLTNMARFPTDIYQKGIQLVLTFTIPVIILITVPAKALLGLLSWQMIVFAFLISGIFLFGSLKFWQYALKRYSSASS